MVPVPDTSTSYPPAGAQVVLHKSSIDRCYQVRNTHRKGRERLAESGGRPGAARPALTIAPHPLRAGTSMSIRVPFARGVLALYDVRGRRVGARTVDGAGLSAAGLTAATLFGHDQPPAPGVYFLRFESPEGEATARVVIVE